LLESKLSCVGNALKKLMGANIIVPVRYLTCQREREIIRKFNGHSKRLPYGYKAYVQIDHRMILNINGKEIMEFCAYSPKYKLSVHQVYKQVRRKDASEFLWNSSF
jgi:Mor family transcriptional regulator